MTIETKISVLFNRGIIPDSVYSYCKCKGISSLGEFVDFHIRNGAFCINGSQKIPIKELAFLLARAKRLISKDIGGTNSIDFESPISTIDLIQEMHANTSIDELFAMELISQRTYNCCCNEFLFRIDDLVKYKESNGTFLKMRNFGKKSNDELLSVLSNYRNDSSQTGSLSKELVFNKAIVIADSFNPRFQKFLWNTICVNLKTFSGNLRQFIDNKFPDFKNYYAHIYTEGIGIFEYVNELSLEDNKKLRAFHRNTISQAVNWLQEYLLLRGKDYICFVAVSEKMDALIAEKNDIDTYCSLSDFLKNYLEEKYRKLSDEKLSARAKRLISVKLPTVISAVPHLNDSYSLFSDFIQKKRIDSIIAEMYSFICEFAELYVKLVTYSDKDIENLEVTNLYPFLLSFQRRFVQQFKCEHGYFPMFYITAQYLKNSNYRNDSIYSLYYGISTGTPVSKDEVAEKYQITGERVRQLVSTSNLPPAHKKDMMQKQDWAQYDLMNDIIISIDSSNYLKIHEEENLKFTYLGFLGILRLLKKYEIVEFNGYYYAVNKTINSKCEIEKTCKAIGQVSEEKYNTDTVFNIKDFIAAWNTFALQERKDIIIVLAKILLDSYGISVSYNGTFTIKQNHIDYETELITLFSERQSTMSVEEMADLLAQKFPDENWSTNLIKRALYSSKKISAVGKSSMFGLSSWGNIYYGSIRDLLVEILSDSSDPLQLDEILPRVVAHYPNTNKKSVYSTMYSDKSERFVLFENGYFGLAGKEYDSIYIELPEEQRFSFEKRIEMFREFVDSYHRFPVSYSGENEGPLKRWLYNVSKDKIAVSEEQKKVLDQLIAEYQTKHYPQSIHEVNFKDNCDAVKEIINTKHRLPIRTEELELYNWLRKYKDSYLIYDDQRKFYFEQLLKYIYSFGFVL